MGSLGCSHSPTSNNTVQSKKTFKMGHNYYSYLFPIQAEHDKMRTSKGKGIIKNYHIYH